MENCVRNILHATGIESETAIVMLCMCVDRFDIPEDAVNVSHTCKPLRKENVEQVEAGGYRYTYYTTYTIQNTIV